MNKDTFYKLFPMALSPGKIESFLHKGEWAIHEVLPILLSEIGPASVCIATFSVSEDSLRPLFFLCEEHQIINLTLLLDATVKRHKLELLLFAKSVTPKIGIDSCHAKILLVENDNYKFGIIGSANMNQNCRWEAGFYFTKSCHYDNIKLRYNEAYAASIKYE